MLRRNVVAGTATLAMFGARSEKVFLQIEQLELHLEELETAQAAAEAETQGRT
jgi:hypothetical protein